MKNIKKLNRTQRILIGSCVGLVIALVWRYALKPYILENSQNTHKLALPELRYHEPSGVIHIDDPRFIKEPPTHILEKFTLDEDGYIIDGPRQIEGGTIDYSNLLSNQEIIASFMKVAFGGGEGGSRRFGYELSQDIIAYESRITKHLHPVAWENFDSHGQSVFVNNLIQGVFQDINELTDIGFLKPEENDQSEISRISNYFFLS